jgi:molybdate transport system permease protein
MMDAGSVIHRAGGVRLGLGWLFGPPALLFGAFVVVPLAALAWRSVDSGALADNVTSSLVLESLRLSAITSTITLVVAIMVGTPLAYLLARREFAGKMLVDLLIDLPIVLPPTVAGVALLVALGRRGIVGEHLSAGGIDIAFTTTAVVMAQLFVSAPFYIRTAKAGFESIAPQYEGVAWTLGASPLRTFWRVTLPLSLPGVAAGALLVFIVALGFFITPALLGGPKQMMISNLIEFSVRQVLNWPFAFALANTLLVGTLALYFVYVRSLEGRLPRTGLP